MRVNYSQNIALSRYHVISICVLQHKNQIKAVVANRRLVADTNRYLPKGTLKECLGSIFRR